MKAQVMKSFKARYKGQVVEHSPGEKLQVNIKVAQPLINGGFIRLLESLDTTGKPYAVKIFSKILNDTVWIITHPDAISFVPDGEIYYLPEEIRNLRGATPEEVSAVHQVKQSLNGVLTSVTEIKESKPIKARKG